MWFASMIQMYAIIYIETVIVNVLNVDKRHVNVS